MVTKTYYFPTYVKVVTEVTVVTVVTVLTILTVVTVETVLTVVTERPKNLFFTKILFFISQKRLFFYTQIFSAKLFLTKNFLF